MHTNNFCRQMSIALVLLMASASFAPPAHTAAFCALRDPTATIYELFPEADNYRSSVRTVGRNARAAVIDELPFTLHFNELGRHTLYIALENEQVAGFVHSRSEQGEWGITEYVWAMTPDGKIEDVRVQRSRDPFVRDMSVKAMSALVAGKSLTQLKQDYFKFMSKPLEKSLLASAMKTLVITGAVWGDELEAVNTQVSETPTTEDPKSLDIARLFNPTANSIKRISTLYAPTIQENLKLAGLRESPAFERIKNVGYLVRDNKDSATAVLIRTPFSLAEPKRFLWWYVDYEGNIMGVVDEYTMQQDSDFDSIVGASPLNIRHCSTLADLAALEITTLSRHYL